MKNNRDTDSLKKQLTFGSGPIHGEKLPYSLKRKSSVSRPSLVKKNSLIDTEYNTDQSEIILNENKTETSLYVKIFRKIKRNILLLITVLFMLYVYYVYLFFYIVPLLYSSKRGLDYRFWYFLDDELYRRGITYFLMFNFFLFFVIYSMAVSLFADPGSISDEYLKYFDLLRNFDRSNPYDNKIRLHLNKLIRERRSTYPILQKTLTIENTLQKEFIIENMPITMESFHKMFGADLLNKNQESSLEEHNLNNYFCTTEFFYRFYYYTRNLTLEKIRKNKNYCVFCKIIRPERSHHCKECRRCVLKMDHHCGILNTCVGFYNYKPWMTFLVFATLMLFLCFVTMADGLGFYLDHNHYGFGTSHCNIFIITLVLVLVAFFSVGELLVTHLLFIAKGVSTIEDKSENMFDQLIKNQNSTKGFLYHMNEIIGGNLCSWFNPNVRKFKVYEGYIWLHGKTYEEFLNDRRDVYLKTLESGFQYIESTQNEFLTSENNLNNESIKKPI